MRIAVVALSTTLAVVIAGCGSGRAPGLRRCLDTGCNTLGGLPVVVDGAVVLQLAGGSDMHCAGPLGRQESWLRELGAARPVVVLDGERIELRTATTVLGGRERRSPASG